MKLKIFFPVILLLPLACILGKKKPGSKKTNNRPAPKTAFVAPPPIGFEGAIRPCPPYLHERFLEVHPTEEVVIKCGEIEVPLDHHDVNSKMLPLEFVYIPKPGETKPTNPYVISQGGPGGSSTSMFISAYPQLKEIIALKGLLVFEYRGTDFREPLLTCDNEKGSLSDCIDYWSRTYDLSLFNTEQVAHDLVYLTRQLDVESFHFYGVSYGTLIGQYLLRMYPEALSSAVLDGLTPYDSEWIDVDREKALPYAIQNLDALCQTDPICVGFNSLRTLYEAKVARLAGTSLYNFQAQLELMLKAGLSAAVPFVLSMDVVVPAQKSPRDLSALINLDARIPDELKKDEGSIIHWAFVCNEIALARNQFQLTLTERTKALRNNYDLICSKVLPRGTKMHRYPLEGGKDTPVFLMSGDLDATTPVYYAERVAAQFPNSQQLVLQGGNHGVFFVSACVRDRVAAFIQDPSRRNDRACPAMPLNFKIVEDMVREVSKRERFGASWSKDWALQDGFLFHKADTSTTLTLYQYEVALPVTIPFIHLRHKETATTTPMRLKSQPFKGFDWQVFRSSPVSGKPDAFIYGVRTFAKKTVVVVMETKDPTMLDWFQNEVLLSALENVAKYNSHLL